MNTKDIQGLIKAEQKKQKNRFIETNDLDDYLVKIQNNADFITHYSSGQCAGFVSFYCNDPSRKLAFITLVLIAPEFRGKGLANLLIDYTLEFCKKNGFKKCELEVREDNLAAIKLYQNCGFKVESKNKGKLLMSFIL